MEPNLVDTTPADAPDQAERAPDQDGARFRAVDFVIVESRRDGRTVLSPGLFMKTDGAEAMVSVEGRVITVPLAHLHREYILPAEGEVGEGAGEPAGAGEAGGSEE